ncbi:MAG: alpha/beta hydrolase, partial [Chitinophagaceae bacterium]
TVVFAHGSGPSTRSVGFFTTFFLNLGINVLTFDKQGAGESTGDWETASLEDLANDVQAGIAFLKTQSTIDPLKIGIMGNSQGGWTGSIAASKVKDLAFLIMRVGAGESVFNTISHEYRGSLLADGFNAKEIDEIMQMYHASWNAAKNGKTWEEGNKIRLTYTSKLWFPKIFPDEKKNTASASKWWLWLQKNLAYDSYPYLTQVKAPTLWLLGEKDWNVNSKVAFERVNRALSVANNKDYKVKILPDMAHNGMVAKTGYYNEPWSFTYAEGFWQQVAQWLEDRNLSVK